MRFKSFALSFWLKACLSSAIVRFAELKHAITNQHQSLIFGIHEPHPCSIRTKHTASLL